jgi:hypothetical protein
MLSVSYVCRTIFYEQKFNDDVTVYSSPSLTRAASIEAESAHIADNLSQSLEHLCTAREIVIIQMVRRLSSYIQISIE